MARFLCPALLVLVLLQAAGSLAWKDGCTDKVTGYSPFFGVKGENKPMTYHDHTSQWKKYGQITKINLYYSWNFKCVQGVKVTYGYDAKNAMKIGIDKSSLTTADIKLADYEWVTKVDVRQQENKCIEYIKLYTNKKASLTFGDTKSTAPLQTAAINRKQGFLAAIRGWEDKVTNKDGKEVAGGLQQLQFVWAVEECPTPESPKPAESPKPKPPTPAPKPKPVCPSQPTLCTTDMQLGPATFCPFVNPFKASVCLGGCCKSAGKCKAPVCSLAGLGADVATIDMLCWGKNSGLFGGLNKCKNLACKLAVPGCTSDLITGNCLGTVVALESDIDKDAKKYVGMPCLDKSSMFDLSQIKRKVLPLSLLTGLADTKGEHVSTLWSVCDCTAQNPLIPTLPNIGLDLLKGSLCRGPLCALIPKLSAFGVDLKDLQIPLATLQQYASLLTPDPINVNMTELLKLVSLPEPPKVTIPDIQLSDLLRPTLPKFPSAEDVVKAVNQFADALGPVADALRDQADDIGTAVTKGAEDIANAAVGSAVAAATGAANVAIDILKQIPSLGLPFQPGSIDLSKLGIDLTKLPRVDLSNLAKIDLGPLDLDIPLTPEAVQAKIIADLKKLFLAKLG